MSVIDLAPGTSLFLARREIGKAFRAAGLDTPELDARLIVAHALALDHARLAADSDRKLTHREAELLASLAARRLKHEPVARIVGMKEFWGLPLRITEAVLVPRPETETVVEAALAAIDRQGPRSRPLQIADLGVGSGALLLALLSELPNAAGIGTDRDPNALALARDNAQRLGLGKRAMYVACDYGAALAGGFDLVVANPPYVATIDISGLAPEVRDFDPRLALDGGIDGLDGYRAIAADAKRLLAPGGHLVVEVGAGQSAAVAALLKAGGLAVDPRARPDLSAIPRAVSARRDP